DLARARGERRDACGRPVGEEHAVQAWVDVRAAGGDALDRGGQLAQRAGLQGVAARAGVQAAVEQVRVGLAGVEQDGEARPALEQALREIDTGCVRKTNVDDRYVGLDLLDAVPGRGRRPGGAD